MVRLDTLHPGELPVSVSVSVWAGYGIRRIDVIRSGLGAANSESRRYI